MTFYSSSSSDSAVFTRSSFYQCRYPGCQKESDFEPNTGTQSDYCQQHNIIQMLSQQQDGYNPFTTPRTLSEWSMGGNTDSSDVASDSSDDQDMSSRVQSDDGSLRPTSAVPPSSSSSSNWGWASAFSSLLTQQAPSKKTKQQQQLTIPAMPQATFSQALQQSITVPQAVPGEVNHTGVVPC